MRFALAMEAEAIWLLERTLYGSGSRRIGITVSALDTAAEPEPPLRAVRLASADGGAVGVFRALHAGAELRIANRVPDIGRAVGGGLTAMGAARGELVANRVVDAVVVVQTLHAATACRAAIL